jgi:hypothetical protein
MLLTVNNDPTGLLSGEHIKALAECDDASTYTECGWFCVLGHRDGRRVVHAHARGGQEEFLSLAASHGYRWTGRGLVAMTAAERQAQSRYDKSGYRHRAYDGRPGRDGFRGHDRSAS